MTAERGTTKHKKVAMSLRITGDQTFPSSQAVSQVGCAKVVCRALSIATEGFLVNLCADTSI